MHELEATLPGHRRRRPGVAGRDTQRTDSTASATRGSSDPHPDDLDRLADLVAEGRAEIPEGLAPAAEERLIGLVRRRARERLIRFIAEEVARDIRRESGTTD